MKYKQWLGDILTILLVIFLVLGVNRFVVAPVVVSGVSMDYTLADGDSMLQFKMASIDRFDVVVFPTPTGEKHNGKVKQYIKRVIGLPGDTIEFRDDRLYLNGVATTEPYLQERLAEIPEEQRPFTRNFKVKEIVPEGKVFVMGDNRNRSKDSEEFGFVDIEVLTETSFIFYPFHKFGFLQQYELNEAGMIVAK
ncbi:signal peptidase I [Aerococcaceae bacterium NML191219]|nr:signal peptidase I [Aerococcaceae bacterium NML191219]